MVNTDYGWDASSFFEDLTSKNKLAQEHHFTFCNVSGLQGFEDAIASMQSSTAFVCVSNVSPGFTEINNTPRTRRVKTVFLAKRYPIDNMDAREVCMDIMRELFRQYLSVLLLEKTLLEEQRIYIDPKISFVEISEYFFSGCACAQFSIGVDIQTDLRYNTDEWVN